MHHAYTIIELIWDPRAMSVLAMFGNDLRKIADVRALTAILMCYIEERLKYSPKQ